MVNTMISIPGYVHLYRSLLRFYDMPENEVREMLYLLNTWTAMSIITRTAV